MKKNKTFTIRKNVFSSKKEGIEYYKSILNKYKKGELLDKTDFKDILDLLDFKESEKIIKKDSFFSRIFKKRTKEKKILNIQVDKHEKYPVNCFYKIYDDKTRKVFSYINAFNSFPPSSWSNFCKACRFVVSDDLRRVKRQYFSEKSKDGLVPCQETKNLFSWTDLVVDHRQPNTFSVIVERFIEKHNIDLKNIKYEKKDGMIFFKDQKLKNDFLKYHKEKANLRIIHKKKNASRSHQGRVKQQKKDLKID